METGVGGPDRFGLGVIARQVNQSISGIGHDDGESHPLEGCPESGAAGQALADSGAVQAQQDEGRHHPPHQGGPGRDSHRAVQPHARADQHAERQQYQDHETDRPDPPPVLAGTRGAAGGGAPFLGPSLAPEFPGGTSLEFGQAGLALFWGTGRPLAFGRGMIGRRVAAHAPGTDRRRFRFRWGE